LKKGNSWRKLKNERLRAGSPGTTPQDKGSVWEGVIENAFSPLEMMRLRNIWRKC